MPLRMPLADNLGLLQQGVLLFMQFISAVAVRQLLHNFQWQDADVVSLLCSRHSGVRSSAAAARHLKSALRGSNALFAARNTGSTGSCGSRRQLRQQVVATQPDPTIPETEKERSPLDYPQVRPGQPHAMAA